MEDGYGWIGFAVMGFRFGFYLSSSLLFNETFQINFFDWVVGARSAVLESFLYFLVSCILPLIYILIIFVSSKQLRGKKTEKN